MLERLLVLAVRSYIKGPAKSWLFTTLALFALRRMRQTVGRQPVVETLSVKPGQTITVEGLQVSHQHQIKQTRREKRAARKAKD
jgi:hypothetical protein